MTSIGFGFFVFFAAPSAVLIALNSRTGMLALTGLGIASFPWVIAWLYQISGRVLSAICYLVMTIGWLRQPSSFDGNPKLALATYLIPWLMASVFLVAIASATLMRRKGNYFSSKRTVIP